MNAWFQLLRIQNVLIGVLTAWLLYQSIIKSLSFRFEIPVSLTNLELILFLIALGMVMMAAYIINDIKDVEIDKINKPNRPLVSGRISIKFAFNIYMVFLIVGTLISIYTSWSMNKPLLAILYPLSFLLLYYYSFGLKSTVLVGNLLIAILCSIIPIVLILVEWELFARLKRQSDFIFALYVLLLYFSIYFIFITTLIREIIKDAEDWEGDKSNNIVTLATKFSPKTSILLAQILLAIFLTSFIYWVFIMFPYLKIGNLMIASVIVFLTIKVFSKLQSHHLTNPLMEASGYMKLVMMLGLAHIVWTAHNF